MDDFSTFLASRRSTRDFLPDPVPMEMIQQIIQDGLTAPSWSNTRPFVVAIATGEVRDRLSEEFLRRWDAVKDFRGSGILRKIGSIFRRYGFPTSNWLVVKKYHKDLLPRSKKIGKDLYAHMGIEREDKEVGGEWQVSYMQRSQGRLPSEPEPVFKFSQDNSRSFPFPF